MKKEQERSEDSTLDLPDSRSPDIEKPIGMSVSLQEFHNFINIIIFQIPTDTNQ